MSRILFVTSEAYPLIKTGGLGDVAGSLPRALQDLQQDVRLLLPAYADAVPRASDLRPIATFTEEAESITLLEGALPDSQLKVWLVDAPKYFDRPGNPYLAANGQPWPDNAQRFAMFSRVATRIALDRAGLEWRPDIVHCNDWQSALVPALLDREIQRPSTVFTIHNLAYQGLFPSSTFKELALPADLWAPDALEFHDQLSFIKGGLVYADRINTVSPTYAQEIQTEEFGYGLDGLLRYRQEVLSGIINGIDVSEWDPGKDPLLVQNYTTRSLANKQTNKLALQKESGMPQYPDLPVLGLVSRLVPQKGIDIILEALPALLRLPLQIVMLGSGEKSLETRLSIWTRGYPDKLSVKIGYNETLAHHIEAGADMYLMPSRFEPCGLNQMYSLRYGTVPIVRNVGGLADTVVDTTTTTLEDKTATGFVIAEDNSEALTDCIRRALKLYEDKMSWRQIQQTGMQQDLSWQNSAREYLALYDLAQQANPKPFPAG